MAPRVGTQGSSEGRVRISRKSRDVIFKREAELLGAALSSRYGLDLPAVVGYLPTELPVAEVRLEELDAVFLLADGSILHLEFQSSYRRADLLRSGDATGGGYARR